MIDLIIQKKLNELPDNIRNAVEQFDWATEILHIAHDNNIQIDDIETFRRETLLVIVGATDAGDFEKNLIKNMRIKPELAEILVTDANTHIFIPLQKLAFSRTELEIDDLDETDYLLEHGELSDEFRNHGIELIDIDEKPEKPKNELQDLADTLFSETDNEEIDAASSFENYVPEPEQITPITVPEKTHYQEPIDESDLRGIPRQKISTEVLTNRLGIPLDVNKKLEERIFEKNHISKNEYFDMSPTTSERISERGDFLKHIGAPMDEEQG